MTTYWSEFTTILLPGLLLMSASAVPVAIGTSRTLSHLRRRNIRRYVRNLWGSTAAGFAALVLLWGSLFGTESSESSTAGLIFLFVPIYSAIGLGVGYGLSGVIYRRLVEMAGTSEQEVSISPGARRLVWIPVAMLSVLLLGIVGYSIQHNDMAVAERASNPETLHWVYSKVLRGEADAFLIPLFLAQNPNTPPDILARLSTHVHPSVRIFVAINRNTDVAVVAGLKNDCSDRVRKVVEETLKLPPGSVSALQPTPNCGAAER